MSDRSCGCPSWASFTMLRLRSFRKTTSSSFVIFTVLCVFSLFLITVKHQFDYCTEPHSLPDGGDCQAISGLRRPSWACYSSMITEIPKFLALYEQRPLKKNGGGMRMDHSFALWYILRAVQPEIVIESGALNGQSTWIIRHALPNARVFSLDPMPPKRILPGVIYFTGRNFIDYAKVDWKAYNVRPENTLVFLDDHQSAYRRIITENPHGFYRFMTEDNYPYNKGDNYSFKWTCERRLKDEWPGWAPDNFNKSQTPTTWEEHLEHGNVMDRVISIYYEFPPIATSSITGQTRYVPGRSSVPIIKDSQKFHQLFSNYPMYEFRQYTHFTYVELKRKN